MVGSGRADEKARDTFTVLGNFNQLFPETKRAQRIPGESYHRALW